MNANPKATVHHDLTAYPLLLFRQAPLGYAPHWFITLLELPVLIDRFDGPIKLLPQRLGEESLDRDVEFLGEHDREAGINIVLGCTRSVSCTR
jgi:hypothetical protein